MPRRLALVLGASTLLAAALVGSWPNAAAGPAPFTALTASASNGWTAAGLLQQPYVAAVLADRPSRFHLLDELTGGWAQDRSGHDRTAAYVDVARLGAPGGLPGNPGHAVRPGDNGRVVAGGAAEPAPGTFTIEAWFSTDATSGGRLVGFESTRDESSRFADRTLHLSPSGRLVFGAWTTQSPRTLVSPRTYADGQWHHVVVTAARHGQQVDATMYVDGAVVASDRVSRLDTYNGWWRIGSGTSPVGPTAPAVDGFRGLVDNVAVYPTMLTAQQVAAHWAAR